MPVKDPLAADNAPVNVPIPALTFLTVISSAFVRTTSPVLPNTEVTRFVPPDPEPPANPMCLT